MAFKGLKDYTTAERFNGKQEARMHLAYRKSMKNKFFNLLVFCKPKDIDPNGVDGAELVRISWIDGLTGAKARKIGIEGEPINVVRKTETIEMDAFNSTYEIDRRQIKSAQEIPSVLKDNADDATLSCVELMVDKVFKAKVTKGDAFNGLDYYFEEGNALSGMNVSTVLNLDEGIVDSKTALQFGNHLRKALNGMGSNKATAVVTTQRGLELIQAYNQVTNVGIKYIKVNDEEYTDFMGLNTCDMADSFFDEEVLAKGIPFYFIRLVKDKTGFVIVTKDGTIFDPIVPNLAKKLEDADGRVYQGSNEIVCAPVPCTIECASRCFVTVGE